jgi:hypothetical protein
MDQMSKIINIVFSLFIALFMLSCSSGEWSSKEKRNLVQQCRDEGGSREYCNCYLDRVLEEFPNPKKFKEIDFESAVNLAKQCTEK